MVPYVAIAAAGDKWLKIAFSAASRYGRRATSRMTWVKGACGCLSILLSAASSFGGSIGEPPRRNTQMTEGTVKFFNETKGFGFITPDNGGADAFVHISAVEASGLRTLANNQRVSYELVPDRRGRDSAANLKAL
jgi:CspA family cold shock protein